MREADLAPYRAAIEAEVPCVMVGHGVYPSLGGRRAVVQASTYRLLRGLGFTGVAITDSLSVVRGRAASWAVDAARAGADLLLFTSSADARRAIAALLPLARRGELDDARRQGAALPRATTVSRRSSRRRTRPPGSAPH